VSAGYEKNLIKAQLQKGVGIFACDEFGLLTDATFSMGKGVETINMHQNMKTGISKDGTSANTHIFMIAWEMVRKDFRFHSHDWTLKVDPDAVLLPDRLRERLRPYTGQNVYMKNCNKYPGADGWPMMYGSLEALSRQALETYYAGAERCRTELQWQAWGEDLFLGNCLNLLGSKAEFDDKHSGDNVCTGADCSDGVTAAYHPFKDATKWFDCWRQATSR